MYLTFLLSLIKLASTAETKFACVRGAKKFENMYLIIDSSEKSFENVDRQLTCDLWPRSRNDLDFQNLIVVESECTTNSKSAIAIKKCTFSTFFQSKAYGTKFNLAIKYVKVNPGSSLHKFQRTNFPNATYNEISFKTIGPAVLEKIF